MSTPAAGEAQEQQQRLRNGALYERTSILVQTAGICRLQAARVFLAGVGGVGGHCAEALVRAGIGAITLVDHDVVSATNKNRQLVALDSVVGHSKVDTLAARLRDINSQCAVTSIDAFVLPETVDMLLDGQPYTHVVDCIDSVECKVALLAAAVRRKLPTFASGGAGGRLDPSLVRVCDLQETEGDALARHCRAQLRKALAADAATAGSDSAARAATHGGNGATATGGGDAAAATTGYTYGAVMMVSSTEKPLPPLAPTKQEAGGRDRGTNGTMSYMPPLYGLRLSAMVIRHVLNPAAVAKEHAAAAKKLAKAQQPAWKQRGGKPPEKHQPPTQQRESSAKGKASPAAVPPRKSHRTEGATDVPSAPSPAAAASSSAPS